MASEFYNTNSSNINHLSEYKTVFIFLFQVMSFNGERGMCEHPSSQWRNAKVIAHCSTKAILQTSYLEDRGKIFL
jgi:hypothetical protein